MIDWDRFFIWFRGKDERPCRWDALKAKKYLKKSSLIISHRYPIQSLDSFDEYLWVLEHGNRDGFSV